jgi:hypothetical protein
MILGAAASNKNVNLWFNLYAQRYKNVAVFIIIACCLLLLLCSDAMKAFAHGSLHHHFARHGLREWRGVCSVPFGQ